VKRSEQPHWKLYIAKKIVLRKLSCGIDCFSVLLIRSRTRGFVSRPTQTYRLTQKREWMLTEKGFDEALRISDIPTEEKDSLPIKSYEVQKVVKKLIETRRPKNYQPFDTNRKLIKTVRETTVRVRGFRQAVIEIYDFRCAVCGLKINSPDSLCWEVEAAHIVPHGSFGRDDLFNGIALCRFHHWAFDVGWFALLDNYKICVSSKLAALPREFGRVGDYELIRTLTQSRSKIRLPSRQQVYPHINSLSWHRQFVFHQ